MAAAPAAAQNIPAYFPAGSAGYDQELGVTVLSRERPLYATPGVNVGGFVIRPELDQGVSYNSNINGVTGSGSWESTTAGAVTVASNWVRDSLDASVGFSHTQFFSFPSESFTNWNVGLGGGYTIDENLLRAAYSHQVSYTLGNTIGAIQTQTPTLNQTDSAEINYTFQHLALSLTPTISASAYRFGNGVVLGRPVSEAFLDRNVVAAGVDARYALSDVGAVLVVARAVNSTFINPQAGQPSNNSNSFQVLAGLDYQVKGPWRFRLLFGVETRLFQASQYATRTAPILEGSVIWTPTGLTTVTGTVSREIEDPQSAGTNGYIATQATLSVDHELLPNVILSAHGGAEYVQYLENGGGQQAQFTFGAAVTRVLNRNARVSVGYDFTEQTGSSNTGNPLDPTTLTTAPFRQSVIGLTLHLAL